MTSTIILLSGILLMSCEAVTKADKNTSTPGDTDIEHVMNSQEVTSDKIEETLSIPESNKNPMINTKKGSDKTVDKKESKPGQPENSISQKNTESIEAPDKSVAIIKEATSEPATQVLDHSAWDQLLKKYVDEQGNVAYKDFQKDAKALAHYLDYLGDNRPKSDQQNMKNEELAYFINLYNAATVKLILDNYPTKSIKDISRPWDKKLIRLGETSISIGDVEHKILRKMKEPRIHFAINCASFSCPKLLNVAFTPSNLEKLLQKATRNFINDGSRNIITKDRLQLSNIFKWYKKDFTEHGTLIDFINKYTDIAIDKNAKINHLKYNWNLNETK